MKVLNMSKFFDFFYDYISPFSYIAFYEAERVAERTGATIKLRPMFLGAVLRATENASPAFNATKSKYLMDDLQRVSAHHGLTLIPNPHFPMMDTRPLLRATIALQGDVALQRKLVHAAFAAVWNNTAGVNVSDWEQLDPVLAAAGLDVAAIHSAAASEEAEMQFRANTDEAIKHGAFGAPSIIVNGDLYFGHDRLDYVERALNA